LSEQSAEFTFGSWSAPEVPLAVEYPLEILDELRAAACDGLQRLARGGLEIGGVLFGSRRDNAIRILTWRPIQCEHASGPAFVLSAKDRAALAQLLDGAEADIDLRGLQPVGWFVSHTRSEICLSAADLEIYAQYFPSAWQVTLVLRPERHGTTRAGFFARAADGSVSAEASPREFALEPLRAKAAKAAAGAGKHANGPPAITAEPFVPKPEAVAFNPRPVELPRFLQQKPSRGRAKWLWAFLALLIAAAAAVMAPRFRDRLLPLPINDNPGTVSLRIEERGRELRIEWDKDSPALRDAQAAAFTIRDAQADRRFPLTPADLRSGAFKYERQSGDVEVRLTALSAAGTAFEESTRFVGSPPPPAVPSPELTAATQERNRLALDLKRAREQLRRETARAARLEQRLNALQNRPEP